MGTYDRLPVGATCLVVEASGLCGRTARQRAKPPFEGYWCDLHRNRHAKFGDPAPSTMRRANPTGWFLAQLAEPTERGCREWTKARTFQGYGQVYWGTQMVNAQRVAYFIAFGVWPLGMVCHHCDNPPCCEPSHLYAGDAGSNAEDCSSRGRYANQRKTHCLRGHLLPSPNDRGQRICKPCRLISNRESRRRRRERS